MRAGQVIGISCVCWLMRFCPFSTLPLLAKLVSLSVRLVIIVAVGLAGFQSRLVFGLLRRILNLSVNLLGLGLLVWRRASGNAFYARRHERKLARQGLRKFC